ncbi:hypothetical protein RS130_20710 [Paraglaciecola aquimarina]|uniref:Polysaccharide biosynthesis protein C-terminal domain-containing protein n=1 Tax=Paraglaciecola aquimarina TaxID=1235557 RepID=A0ABU3T139_9ALTE|nr:hypothetical protein [Paraglaciecola aquimarina]MDU0355989.1 hypothetical protein [Paraglaciecola aquimarina]
MVFTIRDLGLIAVIYALAIRVFVVMAVNFYAMSKVLSNVNMSFIRSCTYSTIASVVMWLSVKAGMHFVTIDDNWLTMLFSIVLAGVSYCASYLLLNPKIIAEIKGFLVSEQNF